MAEGENASTKPRRQEQEPASEEVTEVAPGILRLQLPIEMPGLGHVNTYALEDDRGVALVDPGLPGERSWRALEDRLATAGIPLRRVHTVVITHSHPDHFGGAGRLVEATGAAVAASDRFELWWDTSGDEELELAGGESPSAAQPDEHEQERERDDDAWVRDRLQRLSVNLERTTPWGGEMLGPDPDQVAYLSEHPTEARQWLYVPPVTMGVRDTQRVKLAGREWVGLFTPGHTNDHLCLFDPTEGVLLSGDHVLPSITPHISGLIAEDPLTTYVESLDRVAGLQNVGQVLPAHGHPFQDLAGRVREIKEHHDERLGRVREISEEIGWGTVQGYTEHLFSKRSWGPMAESEAYAHLEHLRIAGRAERRSDDGQMLYLVP